MFSRRKEPLNLSQCKYLESRLCEFAARADRCALANANAPRLPILSENDREDADDFLDKALVMLSALGWNFFQPMPDSVGQAAAPAPVPSAPPPPPDVPLGLKPLLEELKAALTGSLFPKAVWYYTRVPDFRAKLSLGADPENFRVFARITWAKKWFWVALKDVRKFRVGTTEDIDVEFRQAARAAYEKAERYLERSKSA